MTHRTGKFSAASAKGDPSDDGQQGTNPPAGAAPFGLFLENAGRAIDPFLGLGRGSRRFPTVGKIASRWLGNQANPACVSHSPIGIVFDDFAKGSRTPEASSETGPSRAPSGLVEGSISSLPIQLRDSCDTRIVGLRRSMKCLREERHTLYYLSSSITL